MKRVNSVMKVMAIVIVYLLGVGAGSFNIYAIAAIGAYAVSLLAIMLLQEEGK